MSLSKPINILGLQPLKKIINDSFMQKKRNCKKRGDKIQIIVTLLG